MSLHQRIAEAMPSELRTPTTTPRGSLNLNRLSIRAVRSLAGYSVIWSSVAAAKGLRLPSRVTDRTLTS